MAAAAVLTEALPSAVSSDSDADDLLLPNLLASTVTAPSSPSRAELHHLHIPSLSSPITVRALPSRGVSFQLWPSASTLLRFLQASPSVLPRPPAPGAPLRFLELGSGTGAAGLALAAALPACGVLSDLPDALPNLLHNADLNAPLLLAAGAAVSVVRLPWGDATAMEELAAASPFDLVVASDVVYYEALVDPLIETLRFFLKGEVVFLMAHMKRWKRTDKKFFGKVRKVFDVEMLHEDPPLEGCRHGPVVYRFTAKKQHGKK